MIEEDIENASGEGEQECWFKERGCIELSEMESGSWRNCCQSEVNPATTGAGLRHLADQFYLRYM